MQLHTVDSPLCRPFLGFRLPPAAKVSTARVSVATSAGVYCERRGRRGGGEGIRAKVREKGNVWSIDNDLAKAEEEGRKRRRGRGRGRAPRAPSGRRGRNSRVLVSAAMLMEVGTVLQMQEPVIKPNWDTFASSVSGIWKGVGAVFSPLTAQIEPIGIGNNGENLYDCYTLTRVEKEKGPSEGEFSQIYRKTSWVPLNPLGESRHVNQASGKIKSTNGFLSKKEQDIGGNLPRYESFDFGKNDEMDEDFLSMEPGMVIFEDGSYSRGPVQIPVGEHDESKYFLCPTFKFEQCLVKGCHRRLRIVHTIEFADGGSNIQIVRVAVYEEKWDSCSHENGVSEAPFDMKPFSQRTRTKPTDLAGSWKVFEVSSTPIFTEGMPDQEGELPYVYLCTETLKKRNLPENQVFFGDEEALDMQDVTVLWLPGGVTGYVDVNKDGILCIGFGWHSDEGANLVMERDYGMDGKLKEVRWKSEVRRRWEEPFASEE